MPYTLNFSAMFILLAEYANYDNQYCVSDLLMHEIREGEIP